MPKTVKVKAAITATLHDGKNMIVLNEGKMVPVAESSLEFLRSREAIVEKKLPQLDHDDNGKAGGSKSAEGDELGALRAQYQEVVGKKPFNGWDAETLRAKIDEAADADADADPEPTDDEDGGAAAADADAADSDTGSEGAADSDADDDQAPAN